MTRFVDALHTQSPVQRECGEDGPDETVLKKSSASGGCIRQQLQYLFGNPSFWDRIADELDSQESRVDVFSLSLRGLAVATSPSKMNLPANYTAETH